MLEKVPFYKFWDKNSGMLGGLVFGAVFSLYVFIMAALIKYILF